jgi:5-methylthioadenosine/S-adenosylhomocysteine deaminase
MIRQLQNGAFMKNTPVYLTFLICVLSILSACVSIATAQPVDFIIEGDYIVTMDAKNTIIRDGAVAIRAGEIVAVDSRVAIHAGFRAGKIVSGEDRILMPGLVNGHSHMAMTLLRGLADDLDLMTWLNDFIFPAEVGFVDEAFVRTGTDLACWEMLAGGTTTVVDMYYFPNTVAESLEDCGMRGIVAATVIGQESPDAKTPELGLKNAGEFINRWKDRSDRVTPALGPHAIYTTPPAILLQVRDAALAADVPISMHIAESKSEIDFAINEYQLSTISLLDRIDFFTPNLRMIGAHVVYPSHKEMVLLATHRVGAIHNPTSNMKVTAGVAPIGDLRAAGVKVGLGTDGAASNNDLDMWEEMRLATLLQKITHGDPTLLPARQVLRMATIDGAAAIGLFDEIGSIETGKRADLIQVALSAPHMLPLYDVESHLVYVADSQDVVTVLVEGALLVEDRAFLKLNIEAIRVAVEDFRLKIAAGILGDQTQK